jgi:hypothetical protein
MAEASESTHRIVSLVFNRDLSDEELEQIRQQTDAPMAVAAPIEAAHHDGTK